MSEENLSTFGKYFVAYGEFHDNLYNKLIHIICIPSIYYTMMYLFRNFLSLAFKGHYLEINYPLLLTFFVTLQGMSKSWVCQGITLAWESVMYFHQRYLTFKSEKEGWEDTLFYWMLTIHIIAWILQIGGHVVFETPAFVTNVITSLSAPFFVTAEILQYFGWRKKEFEQIQVVIDNKIATYKNIKQLYTVKHDS